MYVINDSCIACGACSDSCPAGAIAMNDDLGRYAIDENTCLDCGSCADACPMGCISAE
ncbi:MAG: 4Fe-4S binding protein [Oscillospiraceae bacterium]|nr:4Fe-4S binding protein [Oscillospiraceae bacterium]